MRKFDPNKSKTAIVLGKREELKYGKGEIKGYYIQDVIAFEQLNTNFKLILADYQKDTENSQADGIMGLSNYKNIPNLFEQLQKEGKVKTSKFAFQLGLKQLKQKSYFYYNISNEDFLEANYLNASLKNYWTIPIREIKMGNKSFSPRHGLVDSGTSLIMLPSSLYSQLDKEFFSFFCDSLTIGGMRKCKCPSAAEYPNITVVAGHLTFNITPTSYILGSFNGRLCMLGIDKMSQDLGDLIILGDIFFHHQIIIFDKQHNRIGFVSNHRAIALFPNTTTVISILNFLSPLALIVVVFVLGLRKKQTISNNLEQPLRSVQMAAS